MGEITSLPIATNLITDLELITDATATNADQTFVYDDSVGLMKRMTLGELSKRKVIPIDSVEVLAGIDTTQFSERQQFNLGSFSPNGESGGGAMLWEPDLAKSLHDGVQYFSPTVPAPADFDNPTDVQNYKDAVGEEWPAGFGIFVLDYAVSRAELEAVQAEIDAIDIEIETLDNRETNTVATLALLSLPVGSKISTKGCLLIGDGGHGGFIVEAASGSPDGYSRVLLANGNHAVLQPPFNILQFGADKSGVGDSSAAVNRFFSFMSSSGKTGYGADGVFKCNSQIVVKSNTRFISNEKCVFHKNYTSALSNGDALFVNENYASDPVYDSNIYLDGLTITEDAGVTLGAYLSVNWIDNFTLKNFTAVKNSTGWISHINARNAVIENYRASSSGASGSFIDGIHFEYLENAVLDNFIIDSEDDCVSFHYQPANNSSAGPNRPSKNIVGSNFVLGSDIANGIRIGAGSIGNVASSNLCHANAQYTDINISNVVIRKIGASGRCLNLYDERTNFTGKHSRINITDLSITNSTSATEMLYVQGNPDFLNASYIAVKNYGAVSIAGNFSMGINGYMLKAGGIDSLTISGDFTRAAGTSSSGSDLEFRQVGTLHLTDLNIKGSAVGQQIRVDNFETINLDNVNISNSGGTEYAALRVNQPDVSGGRIRWTGGRVVGQARSIGVISAVGLNSFVYAGVDDSQRTGSRFDGSLTYTWSLVSTGS